MMEYLSLIKNEKVEKKEPVAKQRVYVGNYHD